LKKRISVSRDERNENQLDIDGFVYLKFQLKERAMRKRQALDFEVRRTVVSSLQM